MSDKLAAPFNTIEQWRDFAGGIAFELRNVLMVVEGYAEMAQNQLDPAHPVAAHIAQIRKAAERARQAVQSLTHQARAHAAK